jgi:hypothetical protein
MLAAKFEVLFPHLDERQRRLLMEAEARALGHSGIRAAGVAENTVFRGVSDLDAGEQSLGRTRRPGGGRKRLADLNPELRSALLALVEPDERGDPMSPLRWTTKSTRRLADELRAHGWRSRRIWLPVCCGRRVSACRPTPRPWRVSSTRTGTRGFVISMSRSRTISPPGTRSSVWMRKEGTGRPVQEQRPAVAPSG